MSQKKMAVVDGANIAYIELSEKGEPKISNIIAVRLALKEKGYEPLIIVDGVAQLYAPKLEENQESS